MYVLMYLRWEVFVLMRATCGRHAFVMQILVLIQSQEACKLNRYVRKCVLVP